MRLFKTLVAWLLLCGVAAGNDHLLVFTASWCGPCQKFKQDLADDPDLTGGLPVELFDIEIAHELTADFDVSRVPTFILVAVEADEVIAATNEIRRETGYTGPRRLRKWLNR